MKQKFIQVCDENQQLSLLTETDDAQKLAIEDLIEFDNLNLRKKLLMVKGDDEEDQKRYFQCSS